MVRIVKSSTRTDDVDFSTLIADLDARSKASGIELLQICRVQNRVRGYDSQAMAWLLDLYRAAPDRFESIMSTLRPALDALTSHKRGR